MAVPLLVVVEDEAADGPRAVVGEMEDADGRFESSAGKSCPSPSLVGVRASCSLMVDQNYDQAARDNAKRQYPARRKVLPRALSLCV